MSRWSTLLGSIIIAGLLFTKPALAHAQPTNNLNFSVKGLNEAMHDNAIAQLTIERNGYGALLTDDDISKIFELGKATTAKAIQPYGYFNSHVSGHLDRIGHTWKAIYQVERGIVMPINKIEIIVEGDGRNNPDIQQLLSALPIKPGNTFTTANYNQLRQLMFTTIQNQGYRNVTVTQHMVEINIENNYANIILHYDTGPIYYFGTITFDETHYDIDLLRSFVDFEAGDTYSQKKLSTLQARLSNTKYFNQVTVTPSVDSKQNQQIPIHIHTQPSPSQEYNFGLGYGTNTGYRTSVGANFNRLTNTGQHATMLLNLSEVNTGLSAKYFIPGPQPLKNEYTTTANIQNFEPSGGDSFSRGLSTGYDNSFNKYWHSSSNINYLHDRFSIGNSAYTTTDFIYPSIFLTRLKSNDGISPTKGSRANILLRAGTPELANTFFQSQLGFNMIQPITQTSLLLLRANVGVTYSKHFNEFPFSLRYFAGGTNSVRGYGEQNLGPGRFLQVGSIELQKKITGITYAGLFFDVGNAENTTKMKLKRGLGVSLTWRTAVGPLSLFVAQANSDKDKPLRIGFNIGAGL